MGVFHIFKIVQMVSNRAAHHIWITHVRNSDPLKDVETVRDTLTICPLVHLNVSEKWWSSFSEENLDDLKWG